MDEPAEVGVAPQGASRWPPVQCSPVGSHGRKRILYTGGWVFIFTVFILLRFLIFLPLHTQSC